MPRDVTLSARVSKFMEQLCGRLDASRNRLEHLCKSLHLDLFLSEVPRWAIVGGLVRDAVLSDNPSSQYFWPMWHDIDIAILSGDPSFPWNPNSKSISSIHRNTFGGWKIFTDKFGTLDVWQAESKTSSPEQLLESIDFGLNAIAFVWPTRQLHIHPRWLEDFVKTRVEKLAANSPRKELQPIRATALAVKLERRLGVKFSMGPLIRHDFDWLKSVSHRTELRVSLDYLRERVEAGRWPKETINRFCEYFSAEKHDPNSIAAARHLDACLATEAFCAGQTHFRVRRPSRNPIFSQPLLF